MRMLDPLRRLSRLACLGLIGAGMAGCAAPPAGGGAMASGDCVALFREYDRVSLFFSNTGGGSRNLVVSPNVSRVAQRVRQAGCVTRARDLAALDALGAELRGTLRGESGAPIRRVSLHVGVVPGISTELQVRAFFGDLGYDVRSVGSPSLGRRIFIGPFVTDGGINEATEVARRAGFVAPYPRNF